METLQHVGDSIQAQHIQVSMRDAYSCTKESDPATVSQFLRERQFDACPVFEGDELIGTYVLPDSIGPSIMTDMRHLEPTQLVTAEAPLIDTARRLCEHVFLYVLQGTRISGFITPMDLAKPAARSYAYLQISALESSLADYLRNRYADPSVAISLLSSGRQAACASLIRVLRESDQFVDELSSCSLMDLIDIAGNDELFRNPPGRELGWGALTRGIANLRDDIMHPSRPLIHPQGLTVRKLTDRLANLQELLRRTNDAAERLTSQPDTGAVNA